MVEDILQWMMLMMMMSINIMLKVQPTQKSTANMMICLHFCFCFARNKNIRNDFLFCFLINALKSLIGHKMMFFIRKKSLNFSSDLIKRVFLHISSHWSVHLHNLKMGRRRKKKLQNYVRIVWNKNLYRFDLG